MPANSRTERPPLQWAINGRTLTFDLINVFTDYPNLRKSIWPALGERVQGTSKIKTCKDIAMRLLQDHEVYSEYVKTEEGLKVYAQSVKTQIHTMEIKWREAKTNLGVTGGGLNHEDEIWKDEKGQKVRDKWEEVKKSCPYYYELKRLLGERLIATDHAVQNSTDPVDTSGVMRDRRPVEPVDDLGSDREGSPIRRTDDESDGDGDKEGEEDAEDQRLDRRQKQKTPRVPNARYFNFKYNLLKYTN